MLNNDVNLLSSDHKLSIIIVCSLYLCIDWNRFVWQWHNLYCCHSSTLFIGKVHKSLKLTVWLSHFQPVRSVRDHLRKSTPNIRQNAFNLAKAFGGSFVWCQT